MLAPSWLHIQHRIGPILRRERDNRQYHRLFHFPGYVTGLRRQFTLATMPRIDADDPGVAEVLRTGQRRLVVFTNKMDLNEEIYFPQIAGHGETIRRALTEMTKPAHRPALTGTPHIALHVRMGDFSQPVSIEALRAGAKNSRIPLAWYCDIVQGLQRQLGRVTMKLYSDGSDEALAELLKIPGVERPAKRASITEMLAIAQADLVVSSGSGFSAWGTYLANSPRICFPGQRFARVLGPPEDTDLEPECATAAEIPTALMERLRLRMAGRSERPC